MALKSFDPDAAFKNVVTLSVRRYPSRGYEVRKILIDARTGGRPRKGSKTAMEMRLAYSLDGGCLIGDPKFAAQLWRRFGIVKPEKRTRTSRVCTVGRSALNKKWYGWSHRAIRGFQTRAQAGRFAESVS